ncbi:hypothetical protein EIN_053470 [Entamoeba invadens IP1]|uniref:hypothetical protein n=1 Tax=Entamoeba invadens IP1 TaxID=370355 RepID=UPI0002C3F68E|nr:hypothetical protein EIN_053470 [Entamoeba invadens IP1]ELP93102.1 hypothetical protein EIN_053470 [Entamoeba invadens IP1]|eukprot:XP_004259873.1 hypothetical protein EIN_053470 [Entamoeba invadens IP1]
MPLIQIEHLVNNGIINVVSSFSPDQTFFGTKMDEADNKELYEKHHHVDTVEVKKEGNTLPERRRDKEKCEIDKKSEADILEMIKKTVIGDENIDGVTTEVSTLKKRIEEFNNNVAIYDDMLREEELSRVCGEGIENGWVTSLEKWTGCDSCRVIYDSTNGFTADTLWGALRLANSVALIVETTENDVFGSFHGVIPMHQHFNVSVDSSHFLFTFSNKFNTGHVKFPVLPTNTKMLDVFKGYNSWVYGIEKGFWIHAQHNKSYVCSTSANGPLTDGYEDPTLMGGVVFTGSVYPQRFTTKRIIGLEMILEQE